MIEKTPERFDAVATVAHDLVDAHPLQLFSTAIGFARLLVGILREERGLNRGQPGSRGPRPRATQSE